MSSPENYKVMLRRIDIDVQSHRQILSTKSCAEGASAPGGEILNKLKALISKP